MKLRNWIRANFYELNPWYYLDEGYNKITISDEDLDNYEVVEHYKGKYEDLVVVRMVNK